MVGDELEDFWARLLSEDEAEIRRAWVGLDVEEAAAVRAHLQRMANGDGYSEVQRRAAARALRVIERGK